MSSMAQRSTDLRSVDLQLTANLIARGEEMLQPIASGSFTPNSQNLTQQVLMRAVGLTRGFLLKVTATLANAGSGNATLTPFGAANLVSNVTLTDLDNYQRINTPGWHLDVLGASKEGFPFGAALLQSATDGPVAYGNNYSAISATATLDSGGGTGTVQMYYWIPCAYGMNDLRGALFTQVVNSAGYVAFTINSTPGVTTGDGTLADVQGRQLERVDHQRPVHDVSSVHRPATALGQRTAAGAPDAAADFHSHAVPARQHEPGRRRRQSGFRYPVHEFPIVPVGGDHLRQRRRAECRHRYQLLAPDRCQHAAIFQRRSDHASAAVPVQAENRHARRFLPV